MRTPFYHAGKSLWIFLFICPTSFYNRPTKISFSFDTSTAANSSDEKTIYIHDDMDQLKLNAELKIDSGDATIQVLNTANNEVVWDGNYKEDSNFEIELSDIKANSAYLLKIETTQSKKVSLIITSDVKLSDVKFVENKEKPEK
ncbi:MAG: hypothetical protein PHG73_05610 [Pygmaiobacter sp.]|nr:hypothetical protein [Pygmaiobacter sp.]